VRVKVTRAAAANAVKVFMAWVSWVSGWVR
jgi:hypothetical protein